MDPGLSFEALWLLHSNVKWVKIFCKLIHGAHLLPTIGIRDCHALEPGSLRLSDLEDKKLRDYVQLYFSQDSHV